MLADGSMPGPLIRSSRERDPRINLNLRKLHLPLRDGGKIQKGRRQGGSRIRRRVDEGRRREIIAGGKKRKGIKTTALIAGTMEAGRRRTGA